MHLIIISGIPVAQQASIGEREREVFMSEIIIECFSVFTKIRVYVICFYCHKYVAEKKSMERNTSPKKF